MDPEKLSGEPLVWPSNRRASLFINSLAFFLKCVAAVRIAA
jgi:hypothetical protein